MAVCISTRAMHAAVTVLPVLSSPARPRYKNGETTVRAIRVYIYQKCTITGRLKPDRRCIINERGTFPPPLKASHSEAAAVHTASVHTSLGRRFFKTYP